MSRYVNRTTQIKTSPTPGLQIMAYVTSARQLPWLRTRYFGSVSDAYTELLKPRRVSWT